MKSDFDLLSNYSSASELREGPGVIWYDEWKQETLRFRMSQVILMKSKFPVIIRKAIDEAMGLSPEQFFDRVNEALFNLFHLTPITIPRFDGNLFIKESKNKGLDCSVDTEDEVEYCLRVFPYLYTFIDSSWIPKTLEALPFYPLLLNVIKDKYSFERISLGEVIENFYESSKIRKDQVSIEVFHSILLRLTKYYYDYQDICTALMELCFSFEVRVDASGESTFRFLIDLESEIFEYFDEGGDDDEYYGPFLHSFLDKRYFSIKSIDNGYSRFKDIFNGGISKYPKQLGFLFHKSFDFQYYIDPKRNSSRRIGKKPFNEACEIFGKDRVTRLAEQAVLKITKARPYALRALLVLAADNPKIEVDAIYLLLRLDPVSLISMRIKQGNPSTKRGIKRAAKALTSNEREAVFQLMRIKSNTPSAPGSSARKVVPRIPGICDNPVSTYLPASFDLVSVLEVL